MEESKTTIPKPYGETKAEAPIEAKVEEPKEKIENLPEWLSYNSSGNLLCFTKKGTFEFADIPYSKVMSAKKRATRIMQDGTPTIDMDNFELMLISESLVNPKVPELEIKEYPGSVVMKLRGAIYKLYDIASFLSL
jgi:hypothetical protein